MKGLVTSILDCSADPENWDSALDAFTNKFGISSCALFSVHEFATMRTNFHVSRLTREKGQELVEILRSGGDVDERWS